ncbi:hypothetical protein GCM10010336_69470 [Streptomyces goshikiensis]|nr:hypothetical protein GCM10010336_69470 [Streptomyces goshikiensis]
MLMRTIGACLTVASSLALSGCSGSAPRPSASPLGEISGQRKSGVPRSVPLSSSALAGRLLTEADLGQDYTRKPETPPITMT